MSMGYSTIAIGGSINAGKQPGVEYNLNGYSTSAGILNCFNALGIVAFAYGGCGWCLSDTRFQSFECYIITVLLMLAQALPWSQCVDSCASM